MDTAKESSNRSGGGPSGRSLLRTLASTRSSLLFSSSAGVPLAPWRQEEAALACRLSGGGEEQHMPEAKSRERGGDFSRETLAASPWKRRQEGFAGMSEELVGRQPWKRGSARGGRAAAATTTASSAPTSAPPQERVSPLPTGKQGEQHGAMRGSKGELQG